MMITHDVNEAIDRADRLVMMTNRPHAHIGEILEVPLAHPHDRTALRESLKTTMTCATMLSTF